MRSLYVPAESLVVTNGCFDVLTPGHVALLEAIKDRFPMLPLLVLINSDDSVKRLKGPSRPIYTESQRLLMLRALRSVNFVEVFTEDTPLQAMERWQGKGWKLIVVKGRGYEANEIVAPPEAQKIVMTEPDLGVSTTQTIQKLKNV